ncbi:MAG: AAA family ATPase [Acidimicrobiaceae bacterium]|nr:AAA family ATPase [Acidimicrobiaceae bacterium]MCY4280705.1 AAA family ATPase [Acidimicrobiaceae bacterium]MCY4293985.1 AAA family ATPase [Acidimicrobiaceae bacterium]
MSERHHADELAWEQSVNARFLRQAADDEASAGRGLEHVAAPSSSGWTGSGPKKPTSIRRTAPLAGRVELMLADEDLGWSFYVGGEGSSFTSLEDGTSVVSWAAPVAQLFYEGREASTVGSEAVDPLAVAARRTFKAQDREIRDFEDDYEPGVDPEAAFVQRSNLHIAGPPGAPTVRLQPPPQPDERLQPSRDRDAVRDRPPDAARSAQPEAQTETTSATAPETPSVSTGESRREQRLVERESEKQPKSSSSVRLRAGRLLQEALEAPKTGEVSPLLATLQPEQYRLVTWSSDENLMVQGHPGTGKTIVAAHRAAFLVLPKDADGEGSRLHKVALVGPTGRWKAHIQPTVTRLVDEGVDVLSIEKLVRDWSGLAWSSYPPSERGLHSLWEIGRIVDRAAGAQQQRLRPQKPAARVRDLVNSLVSDAETLRQFAPPGNADLSDWLLRAGDHKRASRDSSYLLFLAAVGLVSGRSSLHMGYQHIVVDEAQDIRPLEWWMLSKMFRAGAQERWSVLGDMNQRRSDFTWPDWGTLADRLELSAADDEHLLKPVELSCGYRSTREILAYAGALLPRGERANHALRNGPEPSVRQVGPNQVVPAAKEEADRLAARYQQGSVAVIAYRQEIVDKIERSLTKRQWRRDSHSGAEGRRILRRGLRGCRLSVVRPVETRGLEYDAVVVVEPADFKTNFGRHGELYTSLTRANQELVVIHSKAIPKELRGRGNRVRG